jgi:hypothetical protein
MTATTLLTDTPAAGQRLARQFADELLAVLPDESATMPAMLRTGSAGRADPAVITAIYFHAISLANKGWRP